MNRNETKIGKSHLPTSAVGSHLTSQKKNKHNNQAVPNPRTYIWWEFGLKMYMPWFSFLWGMRDEVLLSGPDTGSVLSHHLFLSVRKELGDQNPKFSLLLPLDLGWDEVFYYPNPGKHRQKLPFMLQRKKPIINTAPDGHREWYTEKSRFFFQPSPFPRKLPLLPLSSTQHIPYILFYNTLGWVGGQRKVQWHSSKGRGILFWPNSGAKCKLIPSALSLVMNLCFLTVIDAAPCKEMPFYYMIPQFLPQFQKQHWAKPHLETFTHFCSLTLLHRTKPEFVEHPKGNAENLLEGPKQFENGFLG